MADPLGAALIWASAMMLIAAGVLALFAFTEYRCDDQDKNAEQLERNSGD